MFTDQYPSLASRLVTKHDGGVWSSQSSGTRGARAYARCARGAQGWTLHVQTPSERSQSEMERTKRLRCGNQTKAEWWDTERFVDGDCSHSKRAVQERCKSTRLTLTLCNHEFLPYRERLGV